MTLTQWLATWFITGALASYPIGEWLHRRRVNREFNQILVGDAASARKARIDKWLSDQEEAYMKDITAQYDIADAITRDDLNRGAAKAGVPPMLLISEDDYHAWQTDEDEQPHGRPAA